MVDNRMIEVERTEALSKGRESAIQDISDHQFAVAVTYGNIIV